MTLFTRKLANLLQYFGISSDNYYHSAAVANYEPDDLLAYYLDHSPRAHFTGPADMHGIPLYRSGGLTDYLPVLDALVALGHCELYRRTHDEAHRTETIKIADWFVRKEDGKGLWLTPFPARKFGLADAFPSAMVQGLAISTLVRACALQHNPEYIACATRALRPYQIDVDKGGVRRSIGDRVFYEEYASPRPHHVLNGFIYSLWGLFDLVRLNSNSTARSLWEDGLASLRELLPRYDMGYWSRYHISGGITNPATIPYHMLHIEQLKVMQAITDEPIFGEYAVRWEGYLRSRFNSLRTLPQKILWNIIRGL